MKVFKKSIGTVLFIICMASMLMTLCACGSEGREITPLSEEEKALLDSVKDDITVITDENFAETVPEMIYHTEDYSGMIYQLEGVFRKEGGESDGCLERTLVNGKEKTVCTLPLVYLTKEIDDGAWIRVTGVISSRESAAVLEVMVAEELPEEGKEELSWNGSAHNH